ncbi:hypothetical protein [Hymenobacter rigui]|uniref:Uncharacterized protein n=1 Tax=Hymenobacter rigui TaxID=334424 RepID=A0A428KPW6_9BACT|nr:hypothetical protein [Hymenobacter rigui]RSK48497.1 hypothetical protein EI291_12330 [Hymenobacter rigui]
MLKPVFLRPASWRARLLLGGLLVVLVFGACSTSDFTAENASKYAPLVLRYRVRKTTNLFIFTSYDTLGFEVRYRGKLLAPRNLCSPDSVEPGAEDIQPLRHYQARWLLRFRCFPYGGSAQAVYLLQLTPAGTRFHLVGTEGKVDHTATFHLLADDRAVWVPRTDTSGTLFDLELLRSFSMVFPALPDSIRSVYGGPVEAYFLAPDRRTLARLFSPDTTTRIIIQDSMRQRTDAPSPALYLDEYNAATHQLQRRRLPGRMLSADNPFRNTRWQPDSLRRWHLQIIR